MATEYLTVLPPHELLEAELDRTRCMLSRRDAIHSPRKTAARKRRHEDERSLSGSYISKRHGLSLINLALKTRECTVCDVGYERCGYTGMSPPGAPDTRFGAPGQGGRRQAVRRSLGHRQKGTGNLARAGPGGSRMDGTPCTKAPAAHAA